MNVDLLDQIERTPGRRDKEQLLRDADHQTREAIRLATDTFITFGITVDASSTGMIADEELAAADAALFGTTAKRGNAMMNQHDWWERGFDVLAQLSARKLTGTAARETFMEWLSASPGPAHTKWALRVVNKDLRCGVSDKTVQKVWPGLLETFGVALAKPYDADKHRLSAGFIEPKLDGLRILIIDGVAYTRNGHVVPGLEHVMQALGSYAHDWVWDGECLDPNVSFEETSGALRRLGGDKTGQVFYPFDVIDRSDWRAKQTPSTIDRKNDLRSLARTIGLSSTPRLLAVQAVRPIFGTYVTRPTVSTMLEARDRFLAGGLEGAMFKAAHEPYSFKRSDAVLKFKRFDTMDVTVIDTVEGTGKHVGKLGALVVEIDGVRFNVGSGYTDSERADLWLKRALLPGRCVEVKYQNKTAQGKGRFPVYVRMRPDKDKRP